MALFMLYIDAATGTTHPESVWLPTAVNIDHVRLWGRVTFRGWHDGAALAAGLLPVGEKSYDFEGNDYLKLATAPLGPEDKSILAVVARVAYTLALARADTISDDKMVSFFGTAKQVELDTTKG